MQTIQNTLFLRRALLADAVITGATGLLLSLGSGFLSSLLALPSTLLLYAGLFLLPFAVLVFLLGQNQQPSVQATQLVIAVNVAWVLGSLWLLFSGVKPNILGVVFVLVQAIAVGFFAVLQTLGLRASSH